MDSDELRRAAEMADLEVADRNNDGSYLPRLMVLLPDVGWAPLDGDVSRSYISSLLVEKVKDNPKLPNVLFPADPAHWSEYELTLCLFGATDEQRIRACMEVLDD